MLSRIIYHPVLFLKRCFAHCFWSLYLQYQESCLSVFNNLRHFLRHLLFLSGVVLIFSEPRLLHSKQKMVSIFSCPKTTLQKVSTFLRLPYELSYQNQPETRQISFLMVSSVIHYFINHFSNSLFRCHGYEKPMAIFSV